MKNVFPILFLFFSCKNVLGGVTFSTIPKEMQFYSRNLQDSGTVNVQGEIQGLGYKFIRLEIYKAGSLVNSTNQEVFYNGSIANFNVSISIHAEFSNYTLQIQGITNGGSVINLASRNKITCGDVFVVSGQSNSIFTIGTSAYDNEFLRCFGSYNQGTPYLPSDTLFNYSTCSIAAGYTGWPIYLMKLISENRGVPICCINGGVGGSSIDAHFPNSSNRQDLNTIYGQLLYRVKKAGLSDGVIGLIWHQGEANSFAASYNNYTSKFSTLRSEFLTDFPSIKQFFVFQTHHFYCGGVGEYEQNLRDDQRKFAYLFSDVSVMSTSGLPGNDNCHYNRQGYEGMAQWIFPLIIKKIYNQNIAADIEAPAIKKACYSNLAQSEITLEFFAEGSSILNWPNDSLMANPAGVSTSSGPSAIQSLKNYFFLDGMSGNIASGSYIGNNKIKLVLNSPSTATNITYTPNAIYNTPNTGVFQAPVITNGRGVGALTFYNFPITLCNTVLALNKIKLVANQANNICILQWQNDDEHNVNIYQIWKSNNGIDWKKLTDVTLNSLGKYIVKDYLNENEYTYYKLGIVNKQQVIYYSNSLKFQLKKFNNDEVLIYPTPANNIVKIDVQNNGITNCIIFNSLSQKIIEQKLLLGINIINVKNLTNGVYFITFSNGKNNQLIKKIQINHNQF